MNKTVAVIGTGLTAWVVGVPLMVALAGAAILVPAADHQRKTIHCAGATASTGGWRVPFVDVDYTITSGFGMRYHPVLNTTRLHTGVDLATPQTEVVAASSGVVTTAGFDASAGNHVVIDHGAGITTRYLHLATIDPAVTVGAPVTIGQTLGLEGTTGTSTGIHLHFTVTRDGTPIDPVPFMRDHGAPLNGLAAGPTQPGVGAELMVSEGGIGFALPQPETRRASLTNPATPIPDDIQAHYQAAAQRYGIPWTLLAGVGMAETNHGRLTATSSAGAQGLMQFMPATFAAYGVDGDQDGRADITNPVDSIFSAANYLVASGVTRGADGVKNALYAYNHADWYVGDVLHYAHAYGGGDVLGTTTDCGPGLGTGDPTLPPLADERLQTVLAWAAGKKGLPYAVGGVGPGSFDCSGFVMVAYSQIGISLPRTAEDQRDWLAAGNGYRIPAGQERPGDLVFTDTYLGPTRIGHVQIVWNPAAKTTIEAMGSQWGVTTGHYDDQSRHAIHEIWRVGNIADQPTTN